VLNIGPAELMVVLVVALLVLGPNKLPDAARQVGRAIGEMRKLSSGFQAEMQGALKEPVEGKPGPGAATTKAAKSGGSLASPRAPAGDTPTSVAGDPLPVTADDAPPVATSDAAEVGSVVVDPDGEAVAPAPPSAPPDVGSARPSPEVPQGLAEPGTDGAPAT
jgi:Tat protein translocase TatB subunit